ncbi:relaxase domain-containing protein [Streptomyces sp. NBC_00984]|uniref:relaxase domain-containing protein n=1 Tax=Streptomyces sp. NBC_00984 TaxID=2903700 RepID=UPI00386EA0CA|nr:relaxase domain-containing protein [Streptomyces sp. NBC_00984]
MDARACEDSGPGHCAFPDRDGFPLLHDHYLILNRVQRLDDDRKPVWGALETRRLLQHVAAARTHYTLTMTTEVCEELGLATAGSAN